MPYYQGTRFFFIIVVLCLGLSACSSKNELPALTAESKVLIFGDTITAGEGVKPEEAYPQQLAKQVNYTVINAGVAQESTAAALERFPQLLIQHQPDVIVFCHGDYDLQQGIDERKIVDNLRLLLRQTYDQEIPTILLGIPKIELKHMPPYPFYRRLARAFGAVYNGAVLSEILASPEARLTPRTPNAAGHKRLAEVLAKMLQPETAS